MVEPGPLTEVIGVCVWPRFCVHSCTCSSLLILDKYSPGLIKRVEGEKNPCPILSQVLSFICSAFASFVEQHRLKIVVIFILKEP